MTLALACALAALASASDTARHAPEGAGDSGQVEGLGVAAVPTLAYNSDEGFGTGGVATLYHRGGGVLPYRNAWTLRIFISTRLVQAHSLTWDAIRPGGLPLRAVARAGFYSTITQNYCGVGNAVRCDPWQAERAADQAGLAAGSGERQDFVRRYYQMRFLRFFGDAFGRWRLRELPHRVELLAGWRGAYYRPGDFFEAGPYPGSLYARDFPGGERGFSNQLLGGVVVDDRDHETFPARGYLVQGIARGASHLLGSTWQYGGILVDASWFRALLPGQRLVLALRLIGDGVLGDPPLDEMARVGGIVDAIAFGGQAMGRGIREHRYLGKLKLVHQMELRSQLVDVTALQQELSFGGALFYDAAWIGYDAADLRGDARTLLAGAGISFRFIWNRDFIVRTDVAVSPHERLAPGIYVIVGNVF
ncbi:MAG: BamA/TamA family outer membrane protein [Deltaproteobacteria bacterium]|nr:BamA/TamA family outer membrane protein [Deltaproteobacteria bacterium]